MKKIPLVFLVFILIFSCKKDKNEPVPAPQPVVVPPPSTESGEIRLEFKDVVDNADLVYGKKFLSPKGDTFSISKFTYYISNIVITRNDNFEYREPSSYHLLDHNESAPNTIIIKNIPPGSYKSVSFMLGVDSTRNCSGAQKGDLDPAKGMFWAWNTGYIFLKLEGNSPASGGNEGSVTYHIGGYAGVNKTQRTFAFDFPATPAVISNTLFPSIKLKSNVNEIFKTPVNLDLSQVYYQLVPGGQAKIIADNYSDMISLDKIQN